MALGQGVLAGKKTYILAGASAITAIAAYLTGEISIGVLLQTIVTALLGATVRAGVASDTDKKLAQLDEIKAQLDKK